jgi:Protein of unknown function (DUF1579)
MMMKRILVCLVASFLASPTMAQDQPPIPKPLPEHQILAAAAGTWDATIRTFGGGSAVSKGTEVTEVLPGGLWVLSRFDGDFDGMKFQGRGQFGFDPFKKKYVGTWIDSMNPILSVLEGSYDAKTKTMTYVGDGLGPDMKTKVTQKMVTTMKDDGSRVFTLYMKFDGAPEEAKFMEITYTKRK